ncbi:19572_t:CDS:1, partial [Racocetra persica]
VGSFSGLAVVVEDPPVPPLHPPLLVLVELEEGEGAPPGELLLGVSLLLLLLPASW